MTDRAAGGNETWPDLALSQSTFSVSHGEEGTEIIDSFIDFYSFSTGLVLYKCRTGKKSENDCFGLDTVELEGN